MINEPFDLQNSGGFFVVIYFNGDFFADLVLIFLSGA
jgi:hypothetical protein